MSGHIALGQASGAGEWPRAFPRRALVTGGAVRLGRALALGCAEDGMDVAIHYQSSEEEAQETAHECRCLGVRAEVTRGDLRRPEECRRVVREAEEALGGVDVLVNSAANFVAAPFDRLTDEQVDSVIDLNLKGPIVCSQAAARGMIERGWGRIVNVADVAGLEPWPRFELHSIAKAGVVMMTKALAQALAPQVLVNAIAPGPVLMPDESSPEQVARSAAKTVLGRVGSPEDVVGALRYLLGADYVTGEVLVVDGGRMVRP